MIAAVVAGLIFVWLASQVTKGNTMPFDLAVRGAMHAWASPLLTRFMRGVTMLGEPWFLIPLGLILAALLIGRRRHRAALVLALAALGAEIIDQVFKIVFHRVRPEAFFGLPQPDNFSFPSGHSFASACFYGALAAILAAGTPRKPLYWSAAICLAALIGASRVYLGVHYPTDVLAGFAAAVVWLVFLFRLSWFNPLTAPSLESGAQSKLS